MLISEKLIDRAIINRSNDSLYQFVKMGWHQVEHIPFVDGRIIYEVCDHLQAVSEGHIQYLLLNQPPGTTKSLITCVFWPVWDWIFHPERKWIYASYDISLTRRDANRSINLLKSTWFTDRWGNLLRDERPGATEFFSKWGGMRFSTSVKGKATGRHGDIQVVDDPVKPRDALGGSNASEVALEDCLAWWTQTMATRVTDVKKSARVIIMQRLHENDLAGHMLRQGGYTHLCLPMHFNESRRCITQYKRDYIGKDGIKKTVPVIGGDWRQKDGDLLWEKRFSKEGIERLKNDLKSPAAISAQLEQSPTPHGGLIFKEDWLKFWHPLGADKIDPNGRPCIPLPTKGGRKIQSWDMNFKGGEGSDRVSGGVWMKHEKLYYLLDNDTDVYDFVGTIDSVEAMAIKHPLAIEKLVENKANGTAVINLLKNRIPGLTPIEPYGGKIDRANSVAPLFRSGFVILPHPELANWVVEYIRELLTFPFGRYDDQVDMTTQVLIYLQSGIALFEEAMKKWK